MLLLFHFVGKILEFTAGATHGVNVISVSEVGDGSSIDRDRNVVVSESQACIPQLMFKKVASTSRHIITSALYTSTTIIKI
ncbi:hypothetical protein DPMN_064488 [Dreissena polymorpha]|uniref:Uncharacterized protein n=1 Tax=Dreissena polymorpha TaxID=45954 RepID=A0A9D4CDX0_DREPO|nr:hypothetical protein DPMN_064488 [Dreissena polymorpha]